MQYTHLGFSFLQWTGDSHHPGVDYNYGAPFEDHGMPVYPYKEGRVAYVQESDKGFGNMIIVRHRDKEYSRYAHLQNVGAISRGMWVAPLTQMAKVGNTGNSSAPHLHFEIFDQVIYDKGPQYYPVGKSVSFVRKHYKNPIEHIGPADVKVKIVAVQSKWDTWGEKINAVRGWFDEHSAGQVNLRFSVEHIDSVPYWDDLKDSVSNLWWDTVVAPMSSFHDITILTMPRGLWQTEKRLGYALNSKHLGTQRIVMTADEHGKRRRNRGWNKDDEASGRIRHEIIHALYDMNNASHRDNLHKHEYENGKPELCLGEINFDALKGWKIPGRVRLFRRSAYDNEKIKQKITKPLYVSVFARSYLPYVPKPTYQT